MDSDGVSAPVSTVTVRAPTVAAGLMTNCAIALVGLFTVTGPDPPDGPPPTEIPSPKLASVVPWTKLVNCPVIVTGRG